MTKYYGDTKYSGVDGFGKKPKRSINWWKVLCWVVGSLAVLFITAWIWILIYFSPSRMSRIASEEASKFLKSDVRIYGLDYHIFHAFPDLTVSLDSIRIVSRTLEGVTLPAGDTLPPNADLLATTGRLEVTLNTRKLLKKKLDISDIEVERPFVNLVEVNDSVNNFNIFPEMKKKPEMPEINIDKVEITGPVVFKFTDLQKKTAVGASLSRLLVENDRQDGYKIDFDCKIDAAIGDLSTVQPLDLLVTGNLAVIPEPLTVKAYPLIVNVEGVATETNLLLKEIKGRYNIDSLDFDVKIPDVLSLLATAEKFGLSVPEEAKQIRGELGVDVSLRLDSLFVLPDTVPKIFTPSMAPPFTLTAKVNGKELRGELPGKLLGNNLGNIPVDADLLDFEGQFIHRPGGLGEGSIQLKHLKVESEGVRVNLQADVENLLAEETEAEGRMTFSSHLEKTLAPVLKKQGVSAKGQISGDVNFSLNIDGLVPDGDITQVRLTDMKVKLDSHAKALNVGVTANNLTAMVNGLKMQLEAKIPELSQTGLKAVSLDFTIDDDSIAVKSKDMSAKIAGLTVQGAGGTMKIPSSATAGADLTITAENIGLTSAGTVANLQDIETGVKGYLLKIPKTLNGNSNTTPVNADEAIIEKRAAHTPLWLVPSVPGTLGALITMADLDYDLKIGKGDLSTPYYLAPISFSNLAMTTDLDRLTLDGLHLDVGNSGLDMRGETTGLAAFLGSGMASDLRFEFYANFSNVDINMLSGAYYAAVEKQTGKPYDFTMAPQGTYTAADSLLVAIPRNLNGTVHLHSNRAEYMGFSFSPLSTDIVLNRGDATLKKLTIGAPYVTVAVDWTYSTSSLSNIGMDLDAQVRDFSFKKFYSAFPDLVEKMPEITNLSGDISADVTAGFEMFPSMFMNPLSLEGKFSIKGTGMQFARAGKIEKITHLMGIKGSEPIHIDNLRIGGSFHDNLLILYPFRLGFDQYRLGFAGVNNLQGDMYYHIALEKSPFHLPFGVNLVGKFSHPEIRLGGTEVKDGRERIISEELNQNIDVNIMTNLHRGWIMFIQEAAKYYLEHGADR